MKNSKNPYPAITALGIKIYNKPVAYVFSKDIKTALTKEQYQTFNKHFGIQTCPLIEGELAIYPWDCESCLRRVFTGELKGSQLFWD